MPRAYRDGGAVKHNLLRLKGKTVYLKQSKDYGRDIRIPKGTSGTVVSEHVNMYGPYAMVDWKLANGQIVRTSVRVPDQIRW